jgi:dihydrolipoamide dehydrogenase
VDSRDVIIIGGGPAGYVAAIRSAQLGRRVTLVERASPGGTCVSRGCIPVRALVRAAELLDLGKSARDFGINFHDGDVDFAKMMARKDTIVKTVSSGVRLLLEGNGVEVIAGTARFLSPTQIEVGRADGTSSVMSAGRAIVATGARCRIPREIAASGAQVVGPDEMLAIRDIPRSLLIIGGGFIGLAFATIFSRLGSRVTLIEEADRILPGMEPEVVAVLEKELKRNKVEIHAGTVFAGMAQSGQAKLTTVEGAGGLPDVPASLILVAESRTANVEDLGLEEAGVRLRGEGGIGVNAGMETSAPGILAAGDVTMERMYTHVAFAQGIVAADNAAGQVSSVDYSLVPLCSNTLPEIACVGLTEEAAKQQGYTVKIGRFPFAANAVATVLGQRTGLVKIVCEAKYGQVLGAHIVGPQASNLISEISLAAKLEATPADIAAVMHSHPTLSEVTWEAARDAMGQAIHMISGGGPVT